MKRILFGLCLFCFFNIYAGAQTNKWTDSLGVEHTEVYPSFKGGEDAWHRFLDDNLQYPRQARRQRIQGKVVLSFVIDEEGDVLNVTVEHGIGSGCDEEATRVIELSPNWNPYTLDGKPVKVKYSYPINFTLR